MCAPRSGTGSPTRRSRRSSCSARSTAASRPRTTRSRSRTTPSAAEDPRHRAVLDDEHRLALHEREVAAAEGRLGLRRKQKLLRLLDDVTLVLLVVDGQDEARER